MPTSSPTSPICHKGWILWLIFFAIIASLIVGGSDRTVLQAYQEGSDRWLHSQCLYNTDTMGFNYLPISAVTYLPFSFLGLVQKPCFLGNRTDLQRDCSGG